MSIPDMFQLNGKRALVTGSSRGIGRAIAFALAGAGAHVVLHGTHDTEPLRATLAEAQKNGWSVEVVTGDLGNEADLTRLLNTLTPPDILVLNASIQRYQTLEEFEPALLEDTFRVNVSSSIRLIRAFLPSMQAKKWGRVIALGSVNQWRQSPRLPVYAATKSALSNIMQNCARKYGPDGITFNVIAPGVIATDRNAAALADPPTVEKLLSVIPAKRFGTAEDCAGTALLLASEAGSYITGTDIAVAGGMQL